MIISDHHLRVLQWILEAQPFPRFGTREKTLQQLKTARLIELTDSNGWAVTADGRQWLKDHPLPARGKA